jgi:hypothetical protein
VRKLGAATHATASRRERPFGAPRLLAGQRDGGGPAPVPGAPERAARHSWPAASQATRRPSGSTRHDASIGQLPKCRSPLVLVTGRRRRRLSTAAASPQIEHRSRDSRTIQRYPPPRHTARSPTRHARLAGAPLNQAPNPSRRNPNSARGTGVPHDSRVPSLEAFGRRPRCLSSPSRWAGIRGRDGCCRPPPRTDTYVPDSGIRRLP